MRLHRTRRRVALPAATVLLVAAVVAGCGEDTGDTAADPGSDGSAGTSSSTTSTSPSPSEGETATAAPSGSASADPTPMIPDWPDCATVWVDGARFPDRYRGCLEAGQPVRSDQRACEFGKPLVRYADKFWAVPAGPVHEVATTLDKDPGWQRAQRQCGG